MINTWCTHNNDLLCITLLAALSLFFFYAISRPVKTILLAESSLEGQTYKSMAWNFCAVLLTSNILNSQIHYTFRSNCLERVLRQSPRFIWKCLPKLANIHIYLSVQKKLCKVSTFFCYCLSLSATQAMLVQLTK